MNKPRPRRQSDRNRLASSQQHHRLERAASRPHAKQSAHLDSATDGRSLALALLLGVFEQGRNLESQITPLSTNVECGRLDARELALARELASGVLRRERALLAVLAPMLKRPFKAKDRDLQLLALLGLYQLQSTRIPAHAAINQTVEICNRLAKPWARALLNAVLRRAQREQPPSVPIDAATGLQDQLGGAPAAVVYSHPDWLHAAFVRDWGAGAAQRLMAANNERAPMWLRVNCRRSARREYAKRLTDAKLDYQMPEIDALDAALLLPEPIAVARLPGFAAGLVSIQDGAAQLAASLLELEPGQRVVDACAAPGGKSMHILEAHPRLQRLVSVEVDPVRAQLIDDSAARLGFDHRATVADFAQLDQWWDKTEFDRVLLDAPCSATGVIRRHPDIKVLRRAEDIEALVERQTALLDAAWQVLRPRGALLYVTCSVLRCENEHQIQAFLRRHPDAEVAPIESACGRRSEPGLQILPGEHNMDGFYFARLRKQHAEQ